MDAKLWGSANDLHLTTHFATLTGQRICHNQSYEFVFITNQSIVFKDSSSSVVVCFVFFVLFDVVGVFLGYFFKIINWRMLPAVFKGLNFTVTNELVPTGFASRYRLQTRANL